MFLLLAAVLRNEQLRRIKVQFFVERQPFDQSDIRIGGSIAAQADFLNEPVEPQADCRIGHAVFLRDFLEGSGGQYKIPDKGNILPVKLRHPVRHGFNRHVLRPPFIIFNIYFNFIKVNRKE